jgi:NO-binding membrane sensor protein with MHYT domain
MIKLINAFITRIDVLKILKVLFYITGTICGFGIWSAIHMFDVGTIPMELTLGIGIISALGIGISVLGYWIARDQEKSDQEDYGFIIQKGK